MIDVTHLVPPADVRRGAAVLAQAVPYLPHGVHVAVVDPGVGTSRRGGRAGRAGRAAGRAGQRAADAGGARRWAGSPRRCELTEPGWLAAEVSPTFHGRDVFAPVAARLALGDRPTDAGPEVDPAALVRCRRRCCAGGRRVHRPRCSPWTTSATCSSPPRADLLASLAGPVEVAGRPAVRGRTFADAPPGSLVVLVDSAGLVAVARNGGRAADLLGVAPGATVTVRGRIRG